MERQVLPAQSVESVPVTDDSFLRGDLYALLGSLLARPPASPKLRDLAGLTAAPGAAPDIHACLQELKDAAQRCTAAAVAREYADLFIGLGRGEVMPYASWYLRNRFMAKPLVNIRGDLALLDMRRRKDVCEFEDHAAVMCEAMARIVATPTVSAGRQADFFNSHLAPWMTGFFEDLQRADSANFYRSVGCLGEHFMQQERRRLPAAASRKE